jgi:hypothetical protein
MEIIIKGIVLKDVERDKINDYFTLVKSKKDDQLIIDYIDDESDEAYHWYFRNALELALPGVVLKPIHVPEVHDVSWKKRNYFSFYGKQESYKADEIYNINKSDVEHIKHWHKMIIEFRKNYTDDYYLNWNKAFNDYFSALDCSITEYTFFHLITALETLLLKDNNELTYRVSLNTAMLYSNNLEERKLVFEKVKKAYAFRSSVIHGDVKEIIKKSKDIELYKKMFDLREIVSRILYITYGKEKEQILSNIERMIFS